MLSACRAVACVVDFVVRTTCLAVKGPAPMYLTRDCGNRICAARDCGTKAPTATRGLPLLADCSILQPRAHPRNPQEVVRCAGGTNFLWAHSFSHAPEDPGSPPSAPARWSSGSKPKNLEPPPQVLWRSQDALRRLSYRPQTSALIQAGPCDVAVGNAEPLRDPDVQHRVARECNPRLRFISVLATCFRDCGARPRGCPRLRLILASATAAHGLRFATAGSRTTLEQHWL